jgi:hypothetical protein
MNHLVAKTGFKAVSQSNVLYFVAPDTRNY